MPTRHDHTSWTPAEDATLADCAARGLSRYETARVLNTTHHDGKPVRSVDAAVVRRSAIGVKVTRPERPPLAGPPPLARPVDPVADPLEWLEKFRPIAMPAPSLPRADRTPTTGLTMVAGDFHFGAQDDAACSVFIETARALKPDRIILNGDLPDLLAVSKYPADARKRHTWSLQDEAAAMATFLRELEAAIPRATVLVETEANHSGNGTASRWWRYLSDRVPALMTLPKAEALLSYQAWWYPEWSRLTLTESVVLADDLLVLHGDIVRKHAAYSARATMEKWSSSVMHSHTHRLGMGHQRIPGLPHRPDGVLKFYEIGCMCRLEPSYATAPNWAHGFAIVREAGDHYGVELVGITDGTAVVTTLGQTVRAA